MKRLDLLGYLALILLLGGCSLPKEEGLQHTWLDVNEISSKIERQAARSTVLEEDSGEKKSGAETPDRKEYTMKEGAGNARLKPFASEDPAVPEDFEGEGVLLNFDNADIYEVIQTIAEILDINYIIDPAVKGTVNIRSGKKIPVESLFTVFKKILQINGLDIRSEGEYQYVYVAQQHAVPTVRSADDIAMLKESPKMITQIIPIMHLASAEALKLVEPYLSDHGLALDMATHNLLLITDFESKIIDCVTILSQLDVSPLASLQVSMIKVKNAPLYDLRDELEELLTAMQINRSDYKGVTVVPLERVNSLLLVGNNRYLLQSAESWMKELDVMPSEGRDNIYIYNVRNSIASELSDLVNSLITDSGSQAKSSTTTTPTPPPAPPAQPGMPAAKTESKTRTQSKPRTSSGAPSSAMQFAGEPLLLADDGRNVILIRALPPDYARIVKLLERLDNMPRQVLIEMMVAEIKLTDELQMGLEWYVNKGSNRFANIFSKGEGGGIETWPGGGFTYKLLADKTNIYTLLNVLATDNNLSVLSSPQVLVLNNETATVNVGDQVPIVTSQITDVNNTTTTASNQTIQYKDTGIILNVTPRINYDGIILIDVDQQVSGVNQELKTGVNSPTISTRQVKTKLAVKDGQSVLIGGLISRNKNATDVGVPLVKDVPFFGNLFKYQSQSDINNELVIIITPHVIESENVLEQYTREFQFKMDELRHELKPVKKDTLPTGQQQSSQVGTDGSSPAFARQ
ncbi:MAG: type II secretion system secretin GspD [Thermodesulfobacteriota bacterium]